MMWLGVVFGIIIRQIYLPRPPVVAELALRIETAHPVAVETHIHSFGASWLCLVGDDRVSS